MIYKVIHAVRKNKWLVAAYTMALVIRIGLAIPLMHDWDGFVFTESAKNMLHGITPYQTVQHNSPIIYPDSERPMTEQWYGYPPLPLLMFTTSYALFVFSGIHMTALLQNVAIKLPFIFGDLFCAYLMMKFLEHWSKKNAKRASLLILFNPLLIWISAAWGMFDIWLVNLILLYLLSIRAKKGIWAGIFLALAPQIKLFPVFFLPACALFFFQSITDRKKRIQCIVSFVCTTLIIDIPFFLSSPQGFMNQNLLMHLSRPPQGIGILGILDYVGYVYNYNVDLYITIGSLLTMGSILLFNLFSLGYIKGKEIRLLIVIFLIYTSTLLFNKVVNEQYYVLLVGLLILLTHVPKKEDMMFGRKFLVFFEEVTTISVLLTGVILGFHFLTFLPPSIADGILKASTNYLVFYISRLMPQLPLYTYPNSLWTYYNLPVTVIYILLIPLISFSACVVVKGFIEVFRTRNDIAHSIKSLLVLPKLTRLQVGICLGVSIIAVVCIIPLRQYLKATNALKLVTLVDSKTKPNFPTHPKIGIFYNTWWNNPSHIPTFADDAWSQTTLTPQDGYYTSKNSYFVQHIRQMKNAGIDFAVVSYHLYDRARYLTFGTYAEKLGLYYAPLIETNDAIFDMGQYSIDSGGNKMLSPAISGASKHAIETYMVSAIIANTKSPALLQMQGKPVIFIYNGYWFFPSWDSVSKERLATNILNRYTKQHRSDPFGTISRAWKLPIHTKNDIIKQYPTTIQEFNAKKVSQKDYNQAFLDDYTSFWVSIRHDVEAKVGPVYILSTYASPIPNPDDFIIQPGTLLQLHVFDDEFFYSLSNTWGWWKNVVPASSIMPVWESQEKNQTIRDRQQGLPVFLTVNPTYKDTVVRGKLGFEIPLKVNGVSVYNWTWQQVMKNKADFVLIASWNEFFEGSAIEPTKEYGSYYLDATKQWIQLYNEMSGH